MFWKKKDKKKALGFSAPKFGPRESFRVRPSLEEPLFISINKKSEPVFDISSGGISFVNTGLTLHKTYTAAFDLPDDGLPIIAEILIIRIKNDEICYAQFVGLSQKTEDRIHQYVLQRQKENMQSGKPPSW
ncbi:MAG: PilZ domain-containing protein [Nitrospinales bacterium]